jgi:hypothetical protein
VVPTDDEKHEPKPRERRRRRINKESSESQTLDLGEESSVNTTRTYQPPITSQPCSSPSDDGREQRRKLRKRRRIVDNKLRQYHEMIVVAGQQLYSKAVATLPAVALQQHDRDLQALRGSHDTLSPSPKATVAGRMRTRLNLIPLEQFASRLGPIVDRLCDVLCPYPIPLPTLPAPTSSSSVPTPPTPPTPSPTAPSSYVLIDLNAIDLVDSQSQERRDEIVIDLNVIDTDI